MPQEFYDATKTHLDRDDSGIVRGIVHVESTAGTLSSLHTNISSIRPEQSEIECWGRISQTRRKVFCQTRKRSASETHSKFCCYVRSMSESHQRLRHYTNLAESESTHEQNGSTRLRDCEVTRFIYPHYYLKGITFLLTDKNRSLISRLRSPDSTVNRSESFGSPLF